MAIRSAHVSHQGGDNVAITIWKIRCEQKEVVSSSLNLAYRAPKGKHLQESADQVISSDSKEDFHLMWAKAL